MRFLDENFRAGQKMAIKMFFYTDCCFINFNSFFKQETVNPSIYFFASCKMIDFGIF